MRAPGQVVSSLGAGAAPTLHGPRTVGAGAAGAWSVTHLSAVRLDAS